MFCSVRARMRHAHATLIGENTMSSYGTMRHGSPRRRRRRDGGEVRRRTHRGVPGEPSFVGVADEPDLPFAPGSLAAHSTASYPSRTSVS